MYLCIDVHYSATAAVAAAVAFAHIDSGRIEKEFREKTGPADNYSPGNFYKRELPIMLKLLRKVDYDLKAIFIDGYVWLSAGMQPGLGAHLYQALHNRVPVIGVAKSAYRDCPAAVEILRGGSRKPLYVTAAGMQKEEAADMIRKMHGPYRLPTMLKYADSLSRKS